jgi:catechol 2,3-dioxygenase-like lactoylglutathione lyase family enzyme
MPVLHHLAVTAINLADARAWYDTVLEVLDYRPGIVSERICTWAGPPPEILVYPAEGDDQSAHTHGRPGWQHLAFAVEERGLVDTVHQAVVTLGSGTVVHEPREYDYMPGYYAVFVTDPSGVRWEVFHTPALTTAP